MTYDFTALALPGNTGSNTPKRRPWIAAFCNWKVAAQGAAIVSIATGFVAMLPSVSGLSLVTRGEIAGGLLVGLPLTLAVIHRSCKCNNGPS